MEILSPKEIKEGKLLAIIAHFFFIGLIILWILNLKKESKFTSFYNRQMIGWNLLSFIYIFFKGSILGFFIKLFLIFLLISSLVNVIAEKKKLMLFFGSTFQKYVCL